MKGLKSNTTYQIRLVATNKQGDSIPSRSATTKTKDGLPPQPSAPKADKEMANNVHISWFDQFAKQKKSSYPIFIRIVDHIDHAHFGSADDEDFNYTWTLQYDDASKVNIRTCHTIFFDGF